MTESHKEQEAKAEIAKALLLNWIPSEIARQPAKLIEYEKALTDDIAGHEIKFLRYGDFLAVMQKRNGQKTMLAIQLSRELWKPPAMPQHQQQQPGQYNTLASYYNNGQQVQLLQNQSTQAALLPATITFRFGAMPSLANRGWASNCGKVFTSSFTYPYQYAQSYSNTPGEIIPIETGLAGPAVDDSISFDGAGTKLYVPCGLGEDIFTTLLEVLGGSTK